MFADGAPLVIFNPPKAFVHASELQRPKVYVPQSVADLLEADVFARQGVGDTDPAFLPADAAVAADQADFKVSRVFEGRELPRQLAFRWLITRSGRLLVERLVCPAGKIGNRSVRGHG